MPKFYTSIDLNGNELKNPVLHKYAGDPVVGSVPGVDGQFLWDTTNKIFYQHNGTTWIPNIGITAAQAAAIVANTAKVTNATHTGDVTGSAALTIADAAVTNAKLAHIATATIKGRKTAATGDVEDLTKADVLGLLNVQDGANAYTHPNHSGDVTSVADGTQTIASKAVTLAKMADMATGSLIYRKTAAAGAPEVQTLATLKTDLAVSKSDVGLANVTNDAQIKKLASSTNGFVPTWNGTTGDALAAGYEVETTLAGSATKLARADAIKAYVDSLIAANDAMIYKGTLGSGGTITAIPTTYNTGWAYKVITATTYAGIACEVGDLIVAIINRAGTGNLNSDWTVIQTNIDGAVTGPASAVGDHFVSFNSTTGKLIKDSGQGAADFATAAHNHDGTYGKKYSADVGGSTNVEITHNLNTRDLAVTLREVASPYAVIMADIEFTTVNTINIKFAVAPSAAQFRVTVIG